MERPPGTMRRIIRGAEGLSEWSGRLAALLIFPLVGALVYEVISRYVFNVPTVWAYDVTYMLYGSHFMLGAAYTLLKGGHIRTDIFYQNWSARRQGLIDATLYLVFFFPGMLFFFWMGWQEALHSWQILERAETTAWGSPLYLLKTVVPITALLVLIQGISEFLKSLYAARTGERL